MELTQARLRLSYRATLLVFAVNGIAFASWAARVPTVARVLDINDAQLGLILLILAGGAIIALPSSGAVISRIGTANTVRLGASIASVGSLILASAMALASVPLTFCGLFLFGMGTGFWDISQNVEGAAVERKLNRVVMPKFHAAFSGGAFLGAVIGAQLSALGVPLALHLLGTSVLIIATALWASQQFLPTSGRDLARADPQEAAKGKHGSMSAWSEPRTLLIGVTLLGAALIEGTANDWLSKATVDIFDLDNRQEWIGAMMFAVFVASMTTFRWFGSQVLGRWGRVPVLYCSLSVALIGLVIFVFGGQIFGGQLWISAIGAVLWGLGAALGFPTGMSAASDDPNRAAQRVSVVSTIGYLAFLVGPAGVGFLAELITLPYALLSISGVLVISILAIPAARPLDPQNDV